LRNSNEVRKLTDGPVRSGWRTEEVYAVGAVRYVGTQSDAIHGSTDLPKVFTPRACVCVAGLIMIFAALAVSRVGPPESNQSSDVNLGAKRFVRAQDGMARGGLEPQIAHRL